METKGKGITLLRKLVSELEIPESEKPILSEA